MVGLCRYTRNKGHTTMDPLHIHTPLVEFKSSNRAVDGVVWLKMEALQPSGSFKLRGIGWACRHYVAGGARRLVSSSGGNAGLAVAYAGRRLGVPVTVVVPATTPARARELIALEGAEVLVAGDSWQESHAAALEMVTRETAYIHPFDDPLIWEGHASLVDEVRDAGIEPDVVVLSVGGGGLLCGVIEGLRRNGWGHIPVVAVETAGADSLSRSVKAGSLIALPAITSIASSLGAKQVAARAFQLAVEHQVISHVVSDAEAVEACIRFAADHRLIVEPACGASLSVLYHDTGVMGDRHRPLVIVCGGVGTGIDFLLDWKTRLGS